MQSSTPSPQLRVLSPSDADLLLYWEHMVRHHRESGTDGDLIFAPLEGEWDQTLEKVHQVKKASLAKSTQELGWERLWVVEDAGQVRGELKLSGDARLPGSLHRATLGTGLERAYRGKGWGAQLLTTSIEWAREQPNLEWIQLYVFSSNLPAIRLYEKFGFKEVGRVPDFCRLYGQKLDDVQMVLKLR